jgi:hypothetical protein
MCRPSLDGVRPAVVYAASDPGGPPGLTALAEVRARHDIQRLTPMVAGPPR